MDETQKHYAKWNEVTESKDYILCDSIYAYSKKSKTVFDRNQISGFRSEKGNLLPRSTEVFQTMEIFS